MPTFVTVKEAARQTGKSASSIRRIIYPIVENDAHPDRVLIEPGVEEAQKGRLAGETFAWKLSEELLHRAVRAESPPEKRSLRRGTAYTLYAAS